MNMTFKRVDSWGQMVFIGITAIIAPLSPFIVTTAYIFVGAWQLVSSTLYLFVGSTEEKRHRKKYWLALISYIIVCFACFIIKALVIATIYLLWFVPAIFALWYCYITVKEANIWPLRRLNP